MAYTPLRAADLNQQIDIEQEDAVDNGRGGRTKVWQLLEADVWAGLVPLRGGEALTLNIQRTTQLWRVTLRYREDVTTKMRLRQGATIFNIRTCVDPYGRRDRIVMDCETGVPT
jgi:SPP1 family predicted phage head-tail adaptor